MVNLLILAFGFGLAFNFLILFQNTLIVLLLHFINVFFITALHWISEILLSISEYNSTLTQFVKLSYHSSQLPQHQLYEFKRNTHLLFTEQNQPTNTNQPNKYQQDNHHCNNKDSVEYHFTNNINTIHLHIIQYG